MSILVTLRIGASGERLVELVKQDPALLPGIVEKAKAHGLIAHHFWATADDILVVDEWPSEEAFQAFFSSAPEIAQVMEGAGAQGPPHIEYWAKLETGDDV